MKAGGTITSVREGSLADSLGLKAGDCITAINRHPLRDVIDYRFLCAEERLIIEFEREGKQGKLRLEKEPNEGLGIDFAQAVFGGIKRCNNNCFFCFIDGLPTGSRPSLFLRDDDYRLSFLFGNFLTLTNLMESDWERLGEQRLSPLYVSVHTTDLGLRRRMLGNPEAPDIIEQLRRLGTLKIRVHGQIVLCPGVNDGESLVQTVTDLAALYPTVQSVAIVPVGVTSHRRKRPGFAFSDPIPFGTEMARRLILQASSWQKECRHRLGVSFVYLADEFHLMSSEEVPPAPAYDGFPQLENGVGMVRTLLDEWARERRRLAHGGELRLAQPLIVKVVCGTAIAPLISPIVAELDSIENLSMKPTPVANRYFGGAVSVSGLLTGRDVIEALRGQTLCNLIVLPTVMLDAAGERFLDDLRPSDIERELGISVAFASSIGELLKVVKAKAAAVMKECVA